MIRESRVKAMPLLRCRRPGCKLEAVTRGLCRSDYASAYKLVQAGLTTWPELERKGKIDETRPTAKAWFLAS